MDGEMNVIVVGGANMDIGGRPANKPVPGDSNPGTVSLRPGGVGRNAAHDLRLLGLEVGLLTAVGEDDHGRRLLGQLEALGVDTSLSLRLADERSSTYLYITDERGEMQLAINDMDIVRRLSPAALEPRLPALNAARAVLMEANLPPETLIFLARKVEVPLYADPVSAAKANRLRGALRGLRAIKPNALEAEMLTGEHDPVRAVRALLSEGVERVFLSLGAQGLLAAEGETLLHLPCEPGPVLDVTGAGDAVMAALIWADLRGMSLYDSARAALRAGAIVCRSPETNPEALRRLGTMNPQYPVSHKT